MPRIIQSVDAFRRPLNISDAHSNRVSFRQGNFGVSTNNVPELIVGFGLAGRLLSCNSSATAIGLSTSKELFMMKTSSRWRKASAHREIGFAMIYISSPRRRAQLQPSISDRLNCFLRARLFSVTSAASTIAVAFPSCMRAVRCSSVRTLHLGNTRDAEFDVMGNIASAL